jgi:hypothetical protein
VEQLEVPIATKRGNDEKRKIQTDLRWHIMAELDREEIFQGGKRENEKEKTGKKQFPDD